MQSRGSLTVALGPGLAPGLAGLGVLFELEERGISLASVIGVNTGAVAGALWAVGSDLALAARVIANLPWPRYLTARDLGESDPLLAALQVLTRRLDFADTGRSFAVATKDLDSGENVWLDEGSLAAAVRASLAVPGLFEPLELGGRRLIDGGMAWPPVAPTPVAFCGDRLLAVSLRVPVAARSAAHGEGFPAHVRNLALYVGRTWPAAPAAGWGSMVVDAEVGGLLDFHKAEEWMVAGRRAVSRWLEPQVRDVTD